MGEGLNGFGTVRKRCEVWSVNVDVENGVI